MEPVVIDIPVNRIADWASFHEIFKNALGFPEFYGRNMDAWIDCMTYVDAADGLSTVNVPLGGFLILRIDDPHDFKKRCPEQYDALIECSAFVNFRRCETGEAPVLALLLNGYYISRSL